MLSLGEVPLQQLILCLHFKTTKNCFQITAAASLFDDFCLRYFGFQMSSWVWHSSASLLAHASHAAVRVVALVLVESVTPLFSYVCALVGGVSFYEWALEWVQVFDVYFLQLELWTNVAFTVFTRSLAFSVVGKAILEQRFVERCLSSSTVLVLGIWLVWFSNSNFFLHFCYSHGFILVEDRFEILIFFADYIFLFDWFALLVNLPDNRK